MDIFTMIVIIVAIVSLNKSYRCRMRAGGRGSMETVDHLMKYIDQLESRIDNLETIVIENEKEKRFARL